MIIPYKYFSTKYAKYLECCDISVDATDGSCRILTQKLDHSDHCRSLDEFEWHNRGTFPGPKLEISQYQLPWTQQWFQDLQAAHNKPPQTPLNPEPIKHDIRAVVLHGNSNSILSRKSFRMCWRLSSLATNVSVCLLFEFSFSSKHFMIFFFLNVSLVLKDIQWNEVKMAATFVGRLRVENRTLVWPLPVFDHYFWVSINVLLLYFYWWIWMD